MSRDEGMGVALDSTSHPVLLAGLSPDITGEARTFDRVHACPRAGNTCLPPRAQAAGPAKVWMSATRS
jgi:hypothetical protein